jgi:5-methylcytosine-specific restriction enzyme subunit McrC
MSADQFGRHDAHDRHMVAAAKLACDLALPTEVAGRHMLPLPDREEIWVRHLFERAIGGFFDVTLRADGWAIHRGKTLNWHIERSTAGAEEFLPGMRTDIVLDHKKSGHRIVIDTKFTSILTRGRWHDETLRSGYLYQIYAYLRSQVGKGDAMADHADGVLLHPSVGTPFDASVVIQGHCIRFITVDLAGSTASIRSDLLKVVNPALP